MEPRMQFHAAIWAPRGTPGTDPEYELRPDEIRLLASRMMGVPVTYDHTGIHPAIETLEDVGVNITKISVAQAMEAASQANPGQKPLGLVTDAWVSASGDGMCAFYTTGMASQSLIQNGALSSVSLTHVAENMQPLELSLCNVPARPGSRVVIAGKSEEAVAAYKAQSLREGTSSPGLPSALTMASAALATEVKDAAMPGLEQTDAAGAKVPMTLQQALQLLPEEARLVLAEKMEGLKTEVTAASTKLEAEKKAAEAAKKREAIQNTDAFILKDQLERMLKAMPEQYRDMYMGSVPSLVDGFASGDPRSAMDAAVRTVMCASRAIQLQDMPPMADFSKRQRTTPGMVATEAPAPAPAPAVAAFSAPEPAAAAAAAAASVPAVAAPETAAKMSSIDRLNAALGMVFD